MAEFNPQSLDAMFGETKAQLAAIRDSLDRLEDDVQKLNTRLDGKADAKTMDETRQAIEKSAEQAKLASDRASRVFWLSAAFVSGMFTAGLFILGRILHLAQ